MKKIVYIFLYILLLGATSANAQSAAVIDRPNPPRLVNDLSGDGFLTVSEQNTLEQKLEKFSNETSNQIVIVIVDDLGGLEPWDYATQLGQKWGVGQSKSDNGVVILLKPTGGSGQRSLFIAVGTGLEGAIPDITTKQIRENEMNPYLKKGENFMALDKGTDVLMALAKGEYNSDEYGKKNSGGSFPKGLIVPIIFLIVFLIIRSSKGGGGNGMMSGATGFFLGSRFGGGGSGGFGGGSSGGGFGGFGGGGFGGGGSGGSW